MKMKHIICLFLSVTMLLCMAACGGKNPEAPTRPSENSSQPTQDMQAQAGTVNINGYNISVVSYDEKYKDYEFYDYMNGGIHPNSYSFPSTKVPAKTTVEHISSKDDFIAFQDTYNDIVYREKDTLIFEPNKVKHEHRANGLSNESDFELLNLFISSPELDPFSSLRCEQFFIPVEGQENKYLCGQFYDASTQTAYIHLGYNGNPHAQYERSTDGELISQNSKATYAMLSIAFHKDALNAVKNIVIVLPDPGTVPSK